VLPLRHFIKEVLRRSRSTCSTLQTALYYIHKVALLLAKVRDPVLCGRRMFLAALICASKFLQDRTYSNRAWAKISSLPVQEINANEKALLEVLDYNLFVNADLFRNWTKRL
ncbi:hypothetical protein P389DRAFT_131384, partial [Cystobasidium minutum MCA 4210]|uniref:uncharacterized protein n=1 Tax=Cystobasidium minutum MCA 4210 TaxID=1397322 RepID=UPI0034CD52F1